MTALVRCAEPGCGQHCHPGIDASDGSPRCLLHLPVPPKGKIPSSGSGAPASKPVLVPPPDGED